MQTATVINDYFKNIASFFRISYTYFQRRNPFISAAANFLNSLYNLLSLNKRLKALKYQVQLQYYRLQKMDKLMNESNPHNLKGGFQLNKYR